MNQYTGSGFDDFLAEEGILEEVTARAYKRLSAASAEPVEEILGEAVARMVAAGDPLRIILFGSQARGDAQPDGDYDFLVIEDSNLPRHRRAVKYRRALLGLMPSKDILVWTPQEAADWSAVPQALVTAAIDEGIVLYERES